MEEEEEDSINDQLSRIEDENADRRYTAPSIVSRPTTIEVEVA